jgi:hypothetical protein
LHQCVSRDRQYNDVKLITRCSTAPPHEPHTLRNDDGSHRAAFRFPSILRALQSLSRRVGRVNQSSRPRTDTQAESLRITPRGLTDPCRSQRDREGLVGQESQRSRGARFRYRSGPDQSSEIDLLPGMKLGEGAWARTNFDPDLDVRIRGLSVEQQAALKSAPTQDSRALVIGTWLAVRHSRRRTNHENSQRGQ